MAGGIFLGGCGNGSQLPPPQIHHNQYEYDDDMFKYIRTNMVDNLQTIKELTEEVKKPKYRIEEATVTYYTASYMECGKTDGITASGVPATEGRTVAADHLPFGTVVEIDGVQYVVEDRFGAGHTNKIDVYVESKEKALKLGKRKVEVKIYEVNK